MIDMPPELHVGHVLSCGLIHSPFSMLQRHTFTTNPTLVVTADALLIMTQSIEGETLRYERRWLQLIIETVGMHRGHTGGTNRGTVLQKPYAA